MKSLDSSSSCTVGSVFITVCISPVYANGEGGFPTDIARFPSSYCTHTRRERKTKNRRRVSTDDGDQLVHVLVTALALTDREGVADTLMMHHSHFGAHLSNRSQTYTNFCEGSVIVRGYVMSILDSSKERTHDL